MKNQHMDWDEITARFIAAGGIVENVVLKDTEAGRGLFPADKNKESCIVLPKNLLIPVEDVTLRDGAISLKDGSTVNNVARSFFEQYNLNTSWGGGGKEQLKLFYIQMQNLPAACIDMLRKSMGFSDWFEPITDDFLLNRFMRSRRIGIEGKQYLMPMVELSNHGASNGSLRITPDAVTLSGKFDGEITWEYRIADTLQIFRGYGFASVERFAFSLPFEVIDQRKNRKIRVGSNTSTRVQSDAKSLIPEIKIDETGADVSFVQLGDRLDPRNGPRIFTADIAPQLEIRAVEFLEGLLHYNRQMFLDLLATVEGDASPMSSEIRKVARLQIESLNMVSFQ